MSSKMKTKILYLIIFTFLDIGFLPRFSKYNTANKITAIISFLITLWLVLAIVKENNIMSVNEEKCIGCKTCLLACPFGAIDLLPQYEDGKEVEQVILDENKKIAYTCDLCKDNEKIACISACPQEALKLVTPIDDKKAKNRQAALSLLLTNK